MNLEEANEKLKKLKDFLRPDEIEWKVGSYVGKGDKVCTVVMPYISSRSCYDRLDEIFGLMWSSNVREVQYKKHTRDGLVESTGFITNITVIGDGFSISREDGAPVTDIESMKGGISDSFKRACHLFGMARELYSYPKIWIVGEHKYIPPGVAKKLDVIAQKFYDARKVTDSGYPIKLDKDGNVVKAFGGA